MNFLQYLTVQQNLHYGLPNMSSSTKKPCGQPSWVTGTKLQFLDQYSNDWQKAVDTGLGAAGTFYTKVTKRFIKKYSWNFDRWKSPDDVPDPDEGTIDDDEADDGLSEDELTRRSTYYHELREVRAISLVWTAHQLTYMQAILVWYHNHNNKISKNNNNELETMLMDISVDTPKCAPRSMRITQYYSKLYYKTRIKAAYNSAWAAEGNKPVDKKAKKKAIIAVRNRVTEDAWEAESEAFRTALIARCDADHITDLDGYEKALEVSKKAPDSPESYHAYVHLNLCCVRVLTGLELVR
jgi:hypothetical protein